jgi:WD40 repeat protein
MTILVVGLAIALAADPAVDRYGDPLPAGAVARLGTVRFHSEDVITHPIVLPGGREVVFAAGPDAVVMDLETGKIVRRLVRPLASKRNLGVIALALAPDGHTLAVDISDHDENDELPTPFYLCDVNTNVILRAAAGKDSALGALAFVNGGRHVAGLKHNGVVCIWDTTMGTFVRELRDPGRKFISLAASPNGSIVATGSGDTPGSGVVELWDANTGKRQQKLAGHAGQVTSVAFSPDGKTLASGGNVTVRLWDVATGRDLRVLRGHAPAPYPGSFRSIDTLIFSPDGRSLASASLDGTIRVWDVGTGQTIDNIPLKIRSNGLAFRDSRTLLIGGAYGLWLRDVLGRGFVNDRAGREEMAFILFSADGRRVFTGDFDAGIRAWDAADGRLVEGKRRDLSQDVVRIQVAHGGKRVAITESHWDRKRETFGWETAVWDAATGEIVRRFAKDGDMAIRISTNGNWLLSSMSNPPDPAEDNVLTIRNVTSGTQIARFKPPPLGQFASLGLTADGRSVYTLENNDPPFRLRKWDLVVHRPVQEYPIPNGDRVTTLVESAGGRRIAAVCESEAIRVWDSVTGRPCWESTDPRYRSNSQNPLIAFSPDGCWLATTRYANNPAEIHLWDARTGTHCAGFPAHAKDVVCLAFSPDSRHLATAGGDGSALIWDVAAITGRRTVGLVDPARQTELWADLAGSDGVGAHAVDCLQTDPTAAVKLLKERLRPAAAVPADRVAPLVAELDNPSFAAREKAQRDLTALGIGAEPAARAARNAANAEVRRRIDTVLERWNGERNRGNRAVEILESVGTPDARKLLVELTGGDPAAGLTQRAKAVLERRP